VNRAKPALVLYPLVLPVSWPPIPTAVEEEVTALFERASSLHRKGDHERTSEMFMAAATHLLNTAGSDGPDFSGARTACYLNAVISASAVDPSRGTSVLEWVREKDSQCYDSVSDVARRVVPRQADSA